MPFKLVGYIIYFILAGIILLLKVAFGGLGKALERVLRPVYRLFNRLYRGFDNSYHRLLGNILDHKVRALMLVLVVLGLMWSGFEMLHKELLPSPDSNKFEIQASTIPAYGFDKTDRIAADIEKKLATIDDVTFVYTESGSVSTFAATSEDISVNNLHFIVECRSPETRPLAMERARQMLQDADLMEFSLFLERNTLSQYLSGGGENFQLKVFYEDINEGKQAVAAILGRIGDMPTLHDIKTTTTEGKPLYVVQFKQGVLDKFDIPRVTVADYINQAVRGEQAGTLKQVQKNYDIFVRVPVKGIMEIRRLMSLPLDIEGKTFFLDDLVDMQERPSIKKITRESQERYFLISADARGMALNEIIARAEKRLSDLRLPINTRYMFSGEEEERRRAFDSLSQAIWLAIMLVYMIMAAKFENLLQPFIIMFTVPMGLVGAFGILLLTGNSLNIISGIGILVLIGIGVNDAIVKVEYSNQLRVEGKGVREAIMTASRVRLRPILMTTFTTVFGVLPMGLMTQTGAELQRPLALVIIGGLICTTFLTLILIPVGYELLENYRETRRKAGETT